MFKDLEKQHFPLGLFKRSHFVKIIKKKIIIKQAEVIYKYCESFKTSRRDFRRTKVPLLYSFPGCNDGGQTLRA